MKYIDLHVHSYFSDGSCSPTELIELAGQADLAAFALTDHDTLEGLSEALAAVSIYNNSHPDKPLEVIPGVEISAAFRKKDIHILGLLVDPDSQELHAALERARIERDSRNEKMAAALNEAGIRVDLAAIQAANADAVITRAHFATYLVETGQAKDYKTAFDHYLGDNTPYYVPRKFIEPADAIRLIRNAGGIPVLAHPLLYHLNEREIRELVSELKSNGLMGIETLYSNNVGQDETFVRRLAREYDLLMTGGSDFHGTPKPTIRIGIGKGNLQIPYEFLQKLKEAKQNLI